MIGDDIRVTVIAVVGDKVRLGVEAPADVRVDRHEVRALKNAGQVEAGPQDGA